MVIAPSKNGIGPFVTLQDGERLPRNLNTEKVVVFRCGNSTDRQLKVIKEFGKLADESLLKEPDPPECNYSGDSIPLHQHEDGTWWFYEETWAFENGPYENYELGWNALKEYCITLQVDKEKP